MPRVLIEMGFVSNKPEGAFLNSEDGQNKLAEAISKAILGYRDDFFKTETAPDQGAVFLYDMQLVLFQGHVCTN